MKTTTKILALTILTTTMVAFYQDARATYFYDLTVGGTATINNGIFNTTSFKSAGTGVIDPFLRIQNGQYEAGYNTSLGKPLDNDNSWNYDVLLSTLQTVNVGGIDYFDFRLDLNEPDNGKDNQITLNQLMIYGNNSPAPLGVTMDSTTGRPVGTIGTLLWDMNAGADPTAYSIMLDYGLRGGGSGDGDMQFLVPVSVFQGQTYVILYSQFGVDPIAGGIEPNAGFEEWNVVKGANTVVPEPSTVVAGALLLVPLGLASIRRLRKQ